MEGEGRETIGAGNKDRIRIGEAYLAAGRLYGIKKLVCGMLTELFIHE